MSQSLRGGGAYKKEFLLSLYIWFKEREFSYHDAVKIAGFEPRVFWKLVNDRLIIRMKEPRSPPHRYKVSMSNKCALLSPKDLQVASIRDEMA
jgi:hypothetical protein